MTLLSFPDWNAHNARFARREQGRGEQGMSEHIRPPGLVSRADELKVLDTLSTVDGRIGASLLLRGDRGIGKTSLLHTAAARATTAGYTVVSVTGLPIEAKLAFSGLHQLVHAFRDELELLPTRQRAVLDQILGLSDGPAPDRLAASTATLALLTEATSRYPVLLLVDDAHWLDRPTAEVLGFVTQRLRDQPFVFVATTTPQGGNYLAHAGIPDEEISPLTGSAAMQVLASRFGSMAPNVRQRIVDESAGNPLVLVELAGALSDDERSGLVPLSAFLPLSRRLAELFDGRLKALPHRTLRLLLLGALDQPGSLETITGAVGDNTVRADLCQAESANVVQVRGEKLIFDPPAIRSAIVRSASPEERRWAHSALAGALVDHPHRQALHLADAAIGPDDTVATVLESTVLRAAKSDGVSVAATALSRAADLSTGMTERCHRRVQAAHFAWLGGQLGWARRLVAESSGSTYAAAASAYFLSYQDGDFGNVHRLLVTALNDHRHTDRQLSELLKMLLRTCFMAAKAEYWPAFDSIVDKLEPQHAARFRLYRDALADPARTGRTVPARLDEAFGTLSSDSPGWHILPIATAATTVDTIAYYREPLRRLVLDERDSRAPTCVMAGLQILSLDCYTSGQWDEADTLANKGIELAEATGYHLLTCTFQAQLALVAAARGQADTARRLSDDVVAWAAPQGAGLPIHLASQAQALAALGQGDYEKAYTHATQVTPAGTLAPYVVIAPTTVMDLVEAAVRTGRTTEARAHVTAALTANVAAISSRLSLIVGGAEAIAASDDEAAALFEKVLVLPENHRWPFEYGRVLLAYGEWLRCTREINSARHYLEVAVDTLGRLGARPWADRARSELRATGLAPARRVKHEVRLTSQEARIAALAATGMTNKQIAAKMFLSPRTVSAHLYSVFPKLRITSRAALRDALDHLNQPDH